MQLTLFDAVPQASQPPVLNVLTLDPVGRYLPETVIDSLASFGWRYRGAAVCTFKFWQHRFQTPTGEARLTTGAVVFRWRALREVCWRCEADWTADPQHYAFGPGDECRACSEASAR
jgi:hypothetical protein